MSAARAGLGSRWRLRVEVGHGDVAGWRRSLGAEAAYLLGGLERYTRVDPVAVRRLVFVCHGNINRSPFAEAVARRCGLRAVSTGLKTSTGAPASGPALRLAPEFGVDLAGHQATDFTDHESEPGDLLLVPETGHVQRLVERGVPPGSIALLGHWATPHRIHLHDPNRLPETYFRTCFTLIDSAVRKLAAQLLAARSPCSR